MKNILSLAFAIIAISLYTSGCADPNTATDNSTDTPAADDGHGHDHGTDDDTAPHGGHLIDLGRNHEYHAELLEDHETESVTIYILDDHLKPLSGGAVKVNLVMNAGDKTQTFEFAAVTADSACEFKSADGDLMSMLETDESSGKLRVSIDEKPFTGTFDHHHDDEDGHSHD